MDTTDQECTSTATAYRAYIFRGARVYAVTFDGEACGHITATDLPQARGIVRRALREAFASVWNQSLIFRGHLEEGQVSQTSFRAALRAEAGHFGKDFVE
jgi:hypothetical protein